EQRLRAMADAVAAYEEVHGVIAEEEIAKQRRSDRRNAVLVETAPPKRPREQEKKRSSSPSAARRVRAPEARGARLLASEARAVSASSAQRGAASPRGGRPPSLGTGLRVRR